MSTLFRVLLCGVLYCGAVGPTFAQSSRVWIVFADKAGSTERVAVTERALERRALRGTAIPADVDLAVSRTYLDRLRTLGVEPRVTSRWFNAVSADLTPEQVAQVQALPFVRSISPLARRISQTVADAAPLAAPSVLDFGLSSTQLQVVHADVTLTQGYTGAGVVLGYLDTWFDFDHPALQHIEASGRLLGVETYTPVQSDYHGLNTTSIALGYADGTLIGPAHGASVLAATTEYAPTETNQEEDNFVAALEWAEAQGVEVVNVSLSYSTFDDGQQSYTYADMNGDTALTTRAADRAAALGVVMVVSAGNTGNDASWPFIASPADGDSVITVGAVTSSRTKSSVSSVGPTADGRTKPDVAAMGSSVYVAQPGGGYSFGNGTSFSAPMVSAVVCQLLEANPTLTPMQVRDVLRTTASQASAPDNLLGWGIIDAEAAVLGAVALSTDPEVPSDADGVSVYPTVLRGSALHVLLGLDAVGQPVRMTLYDVLGREQAVLYDGPATAHLAVRLPSLAAGTYVYHLTRPDAPPATGRVVVVR